ncbi:uncharacterized protein [Rutidosis leptorrhynchoides]|uniref:uncharacterized protein n=1 Tax=Rutidosis leptorrhynchoides TaxID=125765 RepID=UPI003A99FE91
MSQDYEPTETSSNNEHPVQEEQNNTTSDTANENETTERYVLPQRVNRGIPPKRYSPEQEAKRSRYPMANIAQGNLSSEAQKFNSALYSEEIPSTVDQAMKSEKWKKAMDEEIEALKKNDTWGKCVIPQEKKPVGSRWSFSPVAKIDTIRVLFSVAANEEWPLHQFDMKNAFLHGELKEEVYVEAPPGFSGYFKNGEVHHMEAVMRIIRYLKKIADHGVMFKRHGYLKTQIYTNASWAGEKGDRKFTSGFFTLVGGNLVAWKSKKQKVVSLSSAESEFRGIAKGVVEALWILTEIGFPPNKAIQILCDNEAAIAISENPVQHDITKHVEIDRHFIREKLDNEIISLPSIRSEDQLADILTKSVNGRLFSEVLSKLNIGNLTIQLEGEC